jgi:hypothetical protein
MIPFLRFQGSGVEGNSPRGPLDEPDSSNLFYLITWKGGAHIPVHCLNNERNPTTTRLIEYANRLCFLTGLGTKTEGHFTHETESLCPLLHFKRSHWWKRRSRSKFTASHYAWGINGVCECEMDVKSTWSPTWHQMDHVSWSLGLFSKTTSWRLA